MKQRHSKILILILAVVAVLIYFAELEAQIGILSVWLYCPDFECVFGGCEMCVGGFNFQEEDLCCFSCTFMYGGWPPEMGQEYCCDPGECEPIWP